VLDLKRPDLADVAPDVRAYIEALEAEMARWRTDRRPSKRDAGEAEATPDEPPTTINVVTVSRSGMAKRTPRHLYSRQRRGGMGVFDLETSEDDPPAFLALVDEEQNLVIVTDQARVFRLPATDIVETPVHNRGEALSVRRAFNAGERVALILPDRGETYVALLTQKGHVIWLAGHLLSDKLRAGVELYDPARFGAPADACWTAGDDDLFIVTRQGRGIRFPARLVPAQGCLGIQLGRDDVAVAVTPVQPDSAVFLLGADGKGMARLMSGFRPNKSPGGGGKIAMKTDHLVSAATVEGSDDVFSVSRLGKIIRFDVGEVPPKENPVKGVNCVALRADEVAAMALAIDAGAPMAGAG
jgi:DNA gyrase subunit A